MGVSSGNHPSGPPRSSWARSFTLGHPASWVETFTGGLGTFVDFFRSERDDDRPPVALALAKLALWISVGMAIATVSAVGLAVMVARTFDAAFG